MGAKEVIRALMGVVDKVARIQENTNRGNWDYVEKDVSALEKEIEKLKNFVKSEKVRNKLDETIKGLKEAVRKRYPVHVHTAIFFGYSTIEDELIDNVVERVCLEYPKEREKKKLGKAIGE